MKTGSGDSSVHSTTVRRGRKGASLNYGNLLCWTDRLKRSLKDKYELDQRGDSLSERENLSFSA